MKYIKAIFFLLAFNTTYGQTKTILTNEEKRTNSEQTPHLKGTIDLDISKGVVTCHFKITNTSPQEPFVVLLNEGFNLKYFKLNNQLLSSTRKNDNEWSTNEFELYANSNDSLPMKSIEGVEVFYTGAFPTFAGSDITTSDDMGVIAIKNHILRATSQSAFTPTLRNKISNQYIFSFTYDITVNCSEPETVYLNGSTPQTGKILYFVNNAPLDFLIYAGKYDVQHQGNLYLLNTHLDKRFVTVLAKTTADISEFYSKVMSMPYDGNVYFSQIFSVGPKDQYTKWAFTVTPTIVMDVDELSTKIDLKSNMISDPKTFRIIAHEMAHKYFMQQLNAIGTRKLWQFYHETLAEYLSLKAVENIVSKDAYHFLLNQSVFTDEAKKKEFVPFEQIETTDRNITNASYNYYPLYLIGFEKMFGSDKTYKLLRQMVLDKDQFTFNTAYFKKRALGTGILQQDFEQYQKNYLNSKNCIDQF